MTEDAPADAPTAVNSQILESLDAQWHAQTDLVLGTTTTAIAQALALSMQNAVAHLQHAETVAVAARAAGQPDRAGLQEAEEHLERVGKIAMDVLERISALESDHARAGQLEDNRQ